MVCAMCVYVVCVRLTLYIRSISLSALAAFASRQLARAALVALVALGLLVDCASVGGCGLWATFAFARSGRKRLFWRQDARQR